MTKTTEPLHFISLGAGVQSSTMALMAARGEIGPMPAAAIFSDTKDEPADVYAWLDWLETQLPFPVIRVTAGSLSEAALATYTNRKTGRPYYSNRIPAFIKTSTGARAGMVGRHCTRDFKIRPILKHVRSLAAQQIRAWRKADRALRKADAPERAPAAVVQWIGISLDEVHRMKPSRDPWCVHRWPLIEKEMKRHDCLRWMEAHGYAKPPRSACRYCPYKSNHEWRKLKVEQPEEFARAAEFERALQRVHAQFQPAVKGKIKGLPFLHRSLVPLEQVELSQDTDRGQHLLSGFGNDCEGMCGL